MKRLSRSNLAGLWPMVLAALFMALLCSCAPASKESAEPVPAPPPAQEPSPAPEEAPAPEAILEPHVPEAVPEPPPPSARDLVLQKISEQHSPLSSIYAPPESGIGNSFYIELHLGPQTTLLSQDVKTFAGDMEGVALGFSSGTIHVLGDFPCRALTLPAGSHIGLLAWHPESPILVVSEAEAPVVRAFELLQCAEIASLEQPSMPNHLALSRDGGRIALVDEVYDLWIGPSIGPLANAARLRFETLDLAFSPAGGIVLVIDQLGWLTSWSGETGERIRTIQIPGGPFSAASIRGGLVTVTDLDGDNKAWNIPDGRFVGLSSKQLPFNLEGSMFTYTAPEPVYQKRLHLGRPILEAAVSRTSEVLRISDIDGTFHYYSTGSGLPAPAVQAEDWEPLEIDADGSATLEGSTFKVADAVHQRGAWRLMARCVPEGALYVWWVPVEGPIQSQASPGELPVRFGVLPDQVEWRRFFTTDAQATMQQE